MNKNSYNYYYLFFGLIAFGALSYLDSIRRYNESFELGEQLDENVLVLEDVSDLNTVMEEVLRLRVEEVSTFLVEQE